MNVSNYGAGLIICKCLFLVSPKILLGSVLSWSHCRRLAQILSCQVCNCRESQGQLCLGNQNLYDEDKSRKLIRDENGPEAPPDLHKQLCPLFASLPSGRQTSCSHPLVLALLFAP